jgi:hypothetical protein
MFPGAQEAEMSESTKNSAPPEYEAPRVTEVGDAAIVIQGAGDWKQDADPDTRLE